MPQPAPLYVPHPERIATTNAWAFLHWLRFTGGPALADWTALQRFSADQPSRFADAIAQFAKLPDPPIRLAPMHADSNISIRLAAAQAGGEPAEARFPPELAAPLTRLWPPALLIRPLAEVLLHADLRPDDRVLIAGPHWPWLVALLQGTSLILASPPTNLLAAVAAERATVLTGPAPAIAQAAFRRPSRPDLSALRTIVATGGPLSPEERTRIYTWVKTDIMLLARTGDTLWGNPLEPVVALPTSMQKLLPGIGKKK
jgi:hypothetical protein